MAARPNLYCWAAGQKAVLMCKPYRFLSGVDNAEFCQRVNDALADGYVLYGNRVMVMDKYVRMVGQPVILPKIANTNAVQAD